MPIICPHCNNSFEITMLEEVMNPTLTISRKAQERSSWYEVANVIKQGESHRLFDVGDSISCTLKNGENVNIIVTAINPYEPNQVAFEFESLLPDEKVMNKTNTNRGGWAESEMKKYMKDVFALLPDDLQAVITPRRITQKVLNDTMNTTDDNFLWLRSITESGEEYEADVGDVVFPYFARLKNRIKELNGNTSWYWSRSPYNSTDACFWSVGYSGVTSSSTAASYYCGVCPCFFIGGTSYL